MILSSLKQYLLSQIHQSQLSKRLFKGISWSLVGSIGGKFFQLLAFMIVARLLGKEAYGQMGIIRSTLAMFLMFSTLGMSTTASRYIAMNRNINPGRAYKIYRFSVNITIAFSLLTSIILVISSGYLATNSLQNSSLQSALLLSAIALFFMSLSNVYSGALSGFESFKLIGINSIINGAIQLVLITIFTYYYQISGVVIAIAIGSLIMAIQYRISLHRNLQKIKQVVNETINYKKIFLKFSLPALLSGVVTFPILWWVKTFMIKHSGYSEMAIYDVAEQWYFIILFIPNSLSNILLPMLSNTSAEGSDNDFRKLILLNLKINIGITALIAIVSALLSPFILKLYGNDFNNYTPLLILLLTAVICAANNVIGQIIVSKGKMWIGFMVNTLWAVWLIAFSFLFVGKLKLGASGLALAFLVSYVLHSILQALLVFSKNTFSKHLKLIANK